MRHTFASAIISHVTASLDGQFYLSDVVGNHNWHFDLASGLLSLGSNHQWHAQLLGTESEATGAWLWAWANEANNITAHLLVASLALKAYGEQHNILELTTPQLPLDQIDGHTLALLASGICEANAYYRCPYEGGALYVLIMDDSFPKCPDPPLQRVATVFPQAIAALEMPDHEQALCGYLDHYGLEHQHTGNQIVVRDDNGEPVLTATFDDQKQLTQLEAKLEAPADTGDEGTASENGPEQNDPADSTPAESWDQAQLRRMMGW